MKLDLAVWKLGNKLRTTTLAKTIQRANYFEIFRGHINEALIAENLVGGSKPPLARSRSR